MAVTLRMREIEAAFRSGEPVASIAERYQITENSVLKKVKSVESAQQSPQTKPHPTTWNHENIKQGIERYITENGVMPSARDFDETPYLPSARQIQRAYGGVVALRKTLGYGDADFTKGKLRRAIAISANKRGLTAEDYFEPLLVERFGEPYVHTQKRYYKGSKCRYDFLVYSQNVTMGIDIFTTDRASYIEKNIRHKIKRYKNAPSLLSIYFVLIGEEFTASDVAKARLSLGELKGYPNMHAVHESEFLDIIAHYLPLALPSDYVSLDLLESKASDD